MNSPARESLPLHQMNPLLTSENSLGTLGITIGFPAVCYAGAFLCNDIAGCPVPSLLHPSSFSLESFKQEIGWPKNGIWGVGSWEVTAWTLAYYFLSLVLQVVLPGDKVQGTVLRDGGRLDYKFNGTFSRLEVTSLTC